jgi:hypothetical protein
MLGANEQQDEMNKFDEKRVQEELWPQAKPLWSVLYSVAFILA